MEAIFKVSPYILNDVSGRKPQAPVSITGEGENEARFASNLYLWIISRRCLWQAECRTIQASSLYQGQDLAVLRGSILKRVSLLSTP